MKLIPLSPLASQTLNTVLGGQACLLNVYQKAYGVYVDLYVNNVLVIGGVIAQNANRIVRYAYHGFRGDLVFFDMQGDSDPFYQGLGDRYQFLYLTQAEVEALLVS